MFLSLGLRGIIGKDRCKESYADVSQSVYFGAMDRTNAVCWIL